MATSTGTANQSTEPAANNQTLTLRSSDGQEFLVPVRAAVLSETLKNMMEDDCTVNIIPLPNVDSKILSKIIVYLNKHADESISDKEKKEFDEKFVAGKPMDVLFDYSLAANYLYIKDLLDIVCQNIADRMKNKSEKWVRKIFNVENDFTPAEEEKLKMENEWAFEGVDPDGD